MAYERKVDTYTLLEAGTPFEMADGHYLMNIDLVNDNGEKVHTVAYENRSDVSNVSDLVEYLANLPLSRGSQVIAKLVDTNNPTTKMLTYLAPALKKFK